MSLASSLLRALLMLSLLLNGANAAMAGDYLLHAGGERAAVSTTAPCHEALEAHEPAPSAHAAHHSDAPPDEDQCRMKECARACAQLPLIGVAGLPPLQGPWRTAAPSTALEADRPAPALPRVVRPPIA